MEGCEVISEEPSINRLGDSLLMRILYYTLSPPYQLELRGVCSKWYRLSKDQTLWRGYFRRDFGEVHADRWKVTEWGGLRSGRIQWENLYFRHLRWTNRPLGVINLLSDPTSYSKLDTLEPTDDVIETSDKELKVEENDNPLRLVTILDSNIFTCFDSSPIQVWSLNDGQYLGELPLPDPKFKATTIACSESDRILAIGDSTGKVMLYRAPVPRKRKLLPVEPPNFTMEYWNTIQTEPNTTVTALHIFRGHLATLSSQGTLSLFKLNYETSPGTTQGQEQEQDQEQVQRQKRIFTTTNHVPSQSPVAMTLRSGPNPHAILLMVAFDIPLYDRTHVVAVQEFTFVNSQLTSTRYLDVTAPDTERANSPITCLAFGGHSSRLHLVTGHGDHTVHVWLVSHDIIHVTTLFGHTGAIRCVAIDDLQPVRVISGSHDRRVKVWSLPSISAPTVPPALLMTLDAHATPIATLATKQDLRLVSGDIAGSWKLWSFDS